MDQGAEQGFDLPTPAPTPAPAPAGTPDPTATPAPTPAGPEERCPCEGPHAEPYAPNDEGLCFTHRDGCGAARACSCSNGLRGGEFMHQGPIVDQGGTSFCQKHSQSGCPR